VRCVRVLLGLVQLGRDPRAETGACSVTRATAPNRLLTGASQTIGKRLCGRLVGTSVAPEYVPKHNSELSGNRGRRPDDAVRLEIGDLQDRRRLPSRDPHTSSRGHCGQGSPGCLGSGGSHVATVDETTACHDPDRVVTSDCETAKARIDARSASLERPAVTAPGRRRRAYGRRHTERHHTCHTEAHARDRAAWADSGWGGPRRLGAPRKRRSRQGPSLAQCQSTDRGARRLRRRHR
jgi:hypothetical protein